MRKAKQNKSRPEPLPPMRKPVRPERFLAVFALSLLVAFGLLVAPVARPAVDLFSHSLVKGSAFLIGAAGGAASVEGTVLRAPANGFAVNMKDGCNGVSVMMLLWCALLAFPATWRWKLKGLLLGSVAIQGLNFVRFISLFYLGQYNTQWFEFAHAYLWEILIMVDAMAVFWVWITMMSRPVRVPDAVS